MKRITHNEYSKSVNIAVDYINKHLNTAIYLKDIAALANISEFHFHRVFKTYVGEALGAYVTRIRLEKVAELLQTSNQTLIEIAEKTGYQSKQSLSKAFKKYFGVNPSSFRKETSYLFQKKEQNIYDIKLTPKIINITPKKVVYKRIIAKYGSEPDYGIAWSLLYSFVKERNLINDDSEYIGLSFDNPRITKEEKCRFYACISTKKNSKPFGEFGVYTINGGKFAVFLHKGSYSKLNNLYKCIYKQWLPNFYSIVRDSISFEKYLNSPENVSEENLLTEIYIPIK